MIMLSWTICKTSCGLFQDQEFKEGNMKPTEANLNQRGNEMDISLTLTSLHVQRTWSSPLDNQLEKTKLNKGRRRHPSILWKNWLQTPNSRTLKNGVICAHTPMYCTYCEAHTTECEHFNCPVRSEWQELFAHVQYRCNSSIQTLLFSQIQSKDVDSMDMQGCIRIYRQGRAVRKLQPVSQGLQPLLLQTRAYWDKQQQFCWFESLFSTSLTPRTVAPSKLTSLLTGA